MSASTLRKYTTAGLVECSRNHAGQRVYTPANIQAYLEENNLVPAPVIQAANRVVFYVRASDGSVERLQNQITLLSEEFGKPERVFQDKASGLNEKRVGLSSLLSRAKKREFDTVAITAKDRLTRFGYSYLETLLGEYDVKLVILDTKPELTDSLEEELMSDFMSLIASFSGKFYRLRGNEQKHKLLDTAKKRLPDG